MEYITATSQRLIGVAEELNMDLKSIIFPTEISQELESKLMEKSEVDLNQKEKNDLSDRAKYSSSIKKENEHSESNEKNSQSF